MDGIKTAVDNGVQAVKDAFKGLGTILKSPLHNRKVCR